MPCLLVGIDEKHLIISSFTSSSESLGLSPDNTDKTVSSVQNIKACQKLNLILNMQYGLDSTRNDISVDLFHQIL